MVTIEHVGADEIGERIGAVETLSRSDFGSVFALTLADGSVLIRPHSGGANVDWISVSYNE